MPDEAPATAGVSPCQPTVLAQGIDTTVRFWVGLSPSTFTAPVMRGTYWRAHSSSTVRSVIRARDSASSASRARMMASFEASGI